LDIYKIDQPPIGSADGLQWEEIKLSLEHAAPLLEAGIISKKAKPVPEASKVSEIPKK
jgi:hypothetical protein